MDRKYVKCVLPKGFAIVEEKENLDGGWFPNIIFFGTDGNILFALFGDNKRKLYDALTKLRDPGADKEDREECNFIVFPESYTLEWKFGWLHVFETNVERGKAEDGLVVIDGTSARKILAAIKKLA